MAELSYQIPEFGRAKRIMRIPESHALYLCPNACGRRQGIRALRNGEADHASFLRFSQTDIVSGAYEEQVLQAVGELLDALHPRPRVLSLYVNCIDDFLGTDEDGLLAELRAAFPGMRFLLSHINPIAADLARSTAKNIHTRLYDALDEVDEHDAGINLVGNFEAPPPSCELYRVLDEAGARPVRQLIACASFDEYLDLAKSRFTLSLSHLGDGAAASMEERFGIASMRWHAAYDVAEVGRRYAALFEALEVTDDARARIDTTLLARRQAAEAAHDAARRAVGDLPVVVDSSASLMPFSLALALLETGFNVAAVFGLHLKGCDDGAEARLLREYPQVVVVRRESYEAIQGYGFSRACLAIGSDAAFLLHAQHTVDLYHDEGFFGYQGIERLARAMVDAVEDAASDAAGGEA